MAIFRTSRSGFDKSVRVRREKTKLLIYGNPLTSSWSDNKMRQFIKFRIKPGGDSFKRTDFDECPAWSEYYDHEELDLIASWGVDRSLVEQQFNAMDTGGAHPHYTILDLENLPHDNMRIFLKAEFRHQSGLKIPGYIMNADAYCIGLFIEEKNVVFSRHPSLSDMMLPAKKEAEDLLGISELFPLTYTTPFINEAGQPIVGNFTFGE